MQAEYVQRCQEIDNMYEELKAKIPENILNMKWGALSSVVSFDSLALLNFPTLTNPSFQMLDENFKILNDAGVDTAMANLDTTVKKAASKADEGNKSIPIFP